MRTGLLWYDANPGVESAHKVARAVRRYRERVGRDADVCYVHPSMMSNFKAGCAGLQILPSAMVQRNYFWVGIKDL